MHSKYKKDNLYRMDGTPLGILIVDRISKRIALLILLLQLLTQWQLYVQLIRRRVEFEQI